LPDEAIDRVFAVMALCPQHRFIVLTKRAERMRDHMTVPHYPGKFLTIDDAGNATDMPRAFVATHSAMCDLLPTCPPKALNDAAAWQDEHCPDGAGFIREWPLPNVILGVSVEDQATADERVPHLLATPAACRMVSAEPLLGSVDFSQWIRGLGWIVSGGESGPGARPMHPGWARSIRDQCQAAGVAYYHKQNGAWAVVCDRDRDDPGWQRCDTVARNSPSGRWLNLAGGHGFHGDRVLRVVPGTKKSSGRLLDGRTHDEFPEMGR
jgi:protein gp37